MYTKLLLVNLKGRDNLRHLDLQDRTTLKLILKSRMQDKFGEIIFVRLFLT